MYGLRLWSVRHARGLESFYAAFEAAMVALDPLWRRIGYQRLERLVAAVEGGQGPAVRLPDVRAMRA